MRTRVWIPARIDKLTMAASVPRVLGRGGDRGRRILGLTSVSHDSVSFPTKLRELQAVFKGPTNYKTSLFRKSPVGDSGPIPVTSSLLKEAHFYT